MENENFEPLEYIISIDDEQQSLRKYQRYDKTNWPNKITYHKLSCKMAYPGYAKNFSLKYFGRR